MGGDDFSAQLMRLASNPGDATLRQRIAEQLDAEGQSALPILAGFVNITGHEDDAGLPCLCKQCLAAAPEKTTAGEMHWTRSFAIAGTRVLHFWQLADQHRAQVRASVAEALRARLKKVK